MYRRKVIVTAAAAFALSVAFAAQPTSKDHSLHQLSAAEQRGPWVPGTNMLMSAHETSHGAMAPPQ